MKFSIRYYQDIFALASGFLFTLAFAPYDYAYLAPLGLVLLFASWQNCSPLRAFLRGYLFGLSSFGIGVWWVYISIHDFGGADSISASLLTALFIVFWSLFPALAGLLCVIVRTRLSLVITPLIWILIEYFRGIMLLNGFPWLLAAYSQLATPLSGYIPILGAYGTGFLLAMTASAIVFIMQHPRHRKALGAGLAVLWTAGYFLQSIQWTQPIGAPFRVAIVQGSISQDKKWRPENRLNTLLLYKKLTEENWGVKVIIWPETAIPAYLSQVQDFLLTPLNQAAQQHDTDLIVSLPIEGEKEHEIYNGAITLGKHNGRYLKNHLLPFGEYMPLQPLSGFILKSLSIDMGDFTPGGGQQPLMTAGGYPFITSICYEDAFGDVAINGISQAAYLVNLTNDAWFGDSVEPHQHLQIARMRAMETGRFMLRSTNTGITAVIGPDGKIIQQAPLFTTTVLTESVTPMGGMTPYAHWGDKPIILIFAIGFVVLLIANRLIYGRN